LRLVAVGLALSCLPGIPVYTLDPGIVLPLLLLLLPPLLHSAATDSSYLDLRAQMRPVALLSVGYVLFATLVVGLIAYLMVPGLPAASALVIAGRACAGWSRSPSPFPSRPLCTAVPRSRPGTWCSS
jgi:CPA1 family monovalent cation:H+ antiporter